MSGKTDNYEKNYALLESITESLNRDEVGIDDLLDKTRQALEAARKCMDILNQQKGEFKKLEEEFGALLEDSTEAADTEEKDAPGGDDPF